MSVSEYIRKIESEYKSGNATEHSYRPALKDLIESYGEKIGAINEPKRVECGSPDYLVVLDLFTIGYIEAKDINISLDKAIRTDQLKRYLQGLHNLIITNYLEFRWFVYGELRASAEIAKIVGDGKLKLKSGGHKKFGELIKGFLDYHREPIDDPKVLAMRMARLTHLISDTIIEAFKKNMASNTLTDLRKAFAETLIPDIDKKEKVGEFADMYAQTIAYGLFAARCNHSGPGTFKRLGAAREIPKTNPFLRKLFETITGTELDDELYAHFVDDLASLLAYTDMEAILSHFGKRKPGQDPVIHFYETFLAAYDSALREKRGVYYTPEPVVRFIVRSVDYLLKTKFGCPNGLADNSYCEYSTRNENGKTIKKKSHRVLILDPACGTGTFLYGIIDQIREKFMKDNNAGMWSGYIKNHLLPRLFGFELLMAPYAVAHFKIGMQLAGQDLPSEKLKEKWSYDFSGHERLGIWLTNTLDDINRKIPDLFGWYKIISEEAIGAKGIKSELPIMVVIGNPPYSGHSANRSWFIDTDGKRQPSFIGKLIRDYSVIDGEKLNERNPKWLQDDYVKFIRWGSWRIEKTGMGILAFITNHSYLDNPTFRGMRRHLMNIFSEIYILDLHGNTKKKEVCSDGSKDENVFDIQQGVAIGIFIKEPGKSGPAKIYHSDLWGLRGSKYSSLMESDVKTMSWEKIDPRSEFYIFAPRDMELEEEYLSAPKISEIFRTKSVGIVTARDSLTIRWSPDEVWQTVQDFAQLPPEKAREKYHLGKDAKEWTIQSAQSDLISYGINKDNIKPILYRPFDIRYTYYTGTSRGFHCRPRKEVMRHMLAGENLALSFHRREELAVGYSHFLCTNLITEHGLLSSKTTNTHAPLYIYPEMISVKNLNSSIIISPKHNFSKTFIDNFIRLLGFSFITNNRGDLKSSFGPEDVFDYIYAVLHSPSYRKRYAEFLRMDFPRIPLTAQKELFCLLCQKGKELVALHLLKSENLSPLITNFPIKGKNIIEKGHPRYLAPGETDPLSGKAIERGRVYISKDYPGKNIRGQYFDGVPPEVWEFYIGGYQVCSKWLKERKGRKLSFDDLEHYQKIIKAISETIKLMSEIDEIIISFGGLPIK